MSFWHKMHKINVSAQKFYSETTARISSEFGIMCLH
jgi:hypothetical protein